MYINNLGHMTKIAAIPIYGKNPSKIFFLQIWFTDFNETLHEASMTQVLHCMYKYPYMVKTLQISFSLKPID